MSDFVTVMNDESPQKPIFSRQQRAIEAFLSGSNKLQAAAAAGVSDETIRRWLRDPDFTERLRKAESESLSDVSRGLVRIGEKAISTLEAVMDSPTAAESVKVRAADTVLARMIPIRELVAVEDRLAAIEARLNGLHGNGGEK